MLLIKINNKKLIQGINYAQKESRSKTFADDTSICINLLKEMHRVRPISLPSIHYKLASCCMTQRLRPLVGKVIGQQQKVYVPGNVIGSCIINILNLLKKEYRIPHPADLLQEGV